MAFRLTWTDSTPVASDDIGDSYQTQQLLRQDIRERFSRQHDFDLNATDGRHIPGKCSVVYVGSTLPTADEGAGAQSFDVDGYIAIDETTTDNFMKVYDLGTTSWVAINYLTLAAVNSQELLSQASGGLTAALRITKADASGDPDGLVQLDLSGKETNTGDDIVFMLKAGGGTDTAIIEYYDETGSAILNQITMTRVAANVGDIYMAPSGDTNKLSRIEPQASTGYAVPYEIVADHIQVSPATYGHVAGSITEAQLGGTGKRVWIEKFDLNGGSVTITPGFTPKLIRVYNDALIGASAQGTEDMWAAPNNTAPTKFISGNLGILQNGANSITLAWSSTTVILTPGAATTNITNYLIVCYAGDTGF